MNIRPEITSRQDVRIYESLRNTDILTQYCDISHILAVILRISQLRRLLPQDILAKQVDFNASIVSIGSLWWF